LFNLRGVKEALLREREELHTICCVDENINILYIEGSRILFEKDLRKKENIVFEFLREEKSC